MAWDHLSINKPHLVYIILGAFTSLFMLCSSFIKERMYIGEATVATLCGVIFGPHAANLIDPATWGNTDQITLEFSRIVLVVQCFAVGVELPKYYMEKHWRSVVFLLIPVMTFGWLVTSLVIWWLIPPLDWLESLCVAACVTATDPVLASSVVGKGKFAKRVPKHLRDLLSAESGCNDGMAFPFIYLALYIIHYKDQPTKAVFDWLIVTVIYECIFGAIYGFAIGYIGRHGIKWAERNDLVDRESFLVFYFVLALFCAGSGSIIGVDDLLVGFAAGVGFSNDGWFTQKTEESHVSNVIDLLLNLAYFVYLGTIIPWSQYYSEELSTTPWRLAVIAIFVILFRRIPIMMALKPFIPDITTWREALFAGHFGPIGVGAIFIAILARADLETGGTTPLTNAPAPGTPHYNLIILIWPITTFLVISSIVVHGSSIAVFTLGKRINTLTLTMSYTTANDEGPSWMNRLPRIASQSKSMSKASSDFGDTRLEDLPPGTLPPIGLPGNFLRRQREDENPSRQSSRASSLVPKRRKKKWEDYRPGGPVSQSAIAPQRRNNSETTSITIMPEGGDSPRNEEVPNTEVDLGEVHPEMQEILRRGEEGMDQDKSEAKRHPDQTEVFQEGDHLIIENEDGDVLAVVKDFEDNKESEKFQLAPREDSLHAYAIIKKKLGVWMHKTEAEGLSKPKEPERKRGPAFAYQFGNTIIVEDADGEVVKKYELPSQKERKASTAENSVRQGFSRMEAWAWKRKDVTESEGSSRQGTGFIGAWTGLGKKGDQATELNETTPPRKSKRSQAEEDDDDRHIRFMIDGQGRRMNKEDFLKEMQLLDPKSRKEVIDKSDAPVALKDMARGGFRSSTQGSHGLFGSKVPQAGAFHREVLVGRHKPGHEAGSPLKQKAGTESLVRSDSSVVTPSTSASTPRNSSRIDITSMQVSETAAERHRREQALKGVSEDSPLVIKPEQSTTRETPADRRRREATSSLALAISRKSMSEHGGESISGSPSGSGQVSPTGETPAEKRRREAALGLLGATGDAAEEEDSEDDNTVRVPPARVSGQTGLGTGRGRGIRFAEEPIRGRRAQFESLRGAGGRGKA